MTTSLKSIPKSELPRERLITSGSDALSNEELLSILLRTGVKGESVTELSRKILSNIEDIHDLKDLPLSRLKSIKGLGLTKSVTILAALELGKRVYENDSPKERLKIKNSLDAYRFFAKYIERETQENFMAIFLDNHKRYITHKIIFKGTLNSSLVHPREIFKIGLLEGASGIIIMHNHPSGVTTPSKADDETTMTIANAGNLIGIQLLDHLIIGFDNYYSYIEEGRLVYEQS